MAISEFRKKKAAELEIAAFRNVGLEIVTLYKQLLSTITPHNTSSTQQPAGSSTNEPPWHNELAIFRRVIHHLYNQY
ncbi:hypothetical protein [Alkalimarinus alittae]|uniref:Uncharacterized protein n=1 Tax=Alkalimarinus alittae TaxID=2961619 RepID=A0ABY6N2T6_9ALTE|nr:hypothetical protein [Alkalimarinus alittae]UZE96411.1 hypothetical protein NKI27_01300 [Alkalimarinus alittae]